MKRFASSRAVSRDCCGRFFRSAFRFKVVGSAIGADRAARPRGIRPVAAGGCARRRVADPDRQSLEGLAGSALYLRSRYDVRAAFLVWAMILRLAGVAVGAQYGLVAAMVGVVVAQLVSTASIGVAGWLAFHRFPTAAAEPFGDQRRGILAFIAQSSAASGVLSLRGGLAPLLLAGVSSTTQTRHLQDRAGAADGISGAVGARAGWCC